MLARYGAVLFRGFAISSPDVFAACAGSLVDELYGDYGDLPRAGDVLGIPSWPTLEPIRTDSSGMTASLGRTSPGLARSGGVTSIPVPDPASMFGSYRALVYVPPQYLLEPARRVAAESPA